MKTRPVCPTCKGKYFTGDKFCATDGTALVNMPVEVCLHCDTVLSEHAKFCTGCGRTREIALTATS